MNSLITVIKLTKLDWSFIIGFFLIAISIGIYTSRSAGKSEENFFLGGRSMPWWLLGFSMVATTFSTDTPNFVTDNAMMKISAESPSSAVIMSVAESVSKEDVDDQVRCVRKTDVHLQCDDVANFVDQVTRFRGVHCQASCHAACSRRKAAKSKASPSTVAALRRSRLRQQLGGAITFGANQNDCRTGEAESRARRS